MTEIIRAPWTSEQVAALEQFQTASAIHPFTCGADGHALAPRLVPSHSGWYCPDPDCDYWQDWAHAFMLRPEATAPPAPAAGSLESVRPCDRGDWHTAHDWDDGQAYCLGIPDGASETDRPAADLRERVARAVDEVFDRWRDGLSQRPQDALVDAVLAALADRDAAVWAAAFKAASNYVRGHSADERYGKASVSTVLCMVSDELRRMAGEAQQAGRAR